MILLDWAVDQSTSKKMRLIYVIGGLLTGVLCYMISMLFIRIKVPVSTARIMEGTNVRSDK